MWHSVGVWFSNHEWLAIWLEGVALLAIFIWDRKDARSSHKETMAQLEIAQKQSQFLINSERAWLTAGLRWSQTGRILQSKISRAGVVLTVTQTSFVLELINNGRTPAWVEGIAASMEIAGSQKQPEGFLMQYIPPLAAAQTHEMEFLLSCPDEPQETENLNVHIKIHYRDIFERRDMSLEFSVNPHNYHISRMEQARIDFLHETRAV
jgi:hypothetical protein